MKLKRVAHNMSHPEFIYRFSPCIHKRKSSHDLKVITAFCERVSKRSKIEVRVSKSSVRSVQQIGICHSRFKPNTQVTTIFDNSSIDLSHLFFNHSLTIALIPLR